MSCGGSKDVFIKKKTKTEKNPTISKALAIESSIFTSTNNMWTAYLEWKRML